MSLSSSSILGILCYLLVTVNCSDLSVEETTVNLEDQNELKEFDPKIWEAPGDLLKKFPYYISGLDFKGQPVFVFEMGKWNMRKYFEEGGDEQILNLYIDQMYHRFSIAETSLPRAENATGQFALICDLDGYDDRQHNYGPSLYFILTMIKKFKPIAKANMDYDVVINVKANYLNINLVNKAAEFLVYNLFAPMVRDAYSKVEVGGIRKETWVPLLLKRIPKESLAPWYSGSASPFRPLAIYG